MTLIILIVCKILEIWTRLIYLVITILIMIVLLINSLIKTMVLLILMMTTLITLGSNFIPHWSCLLLLVIRKIVLGSLLIVFNIIHSNYFIQIYFYNFHKSEIM